MNINTVFFEDLLAEGVPVHVAARVVEERKSGPFLDWEDALRRLFYTQGLQPGIRPADGALLRYVKGCFLPASSPAPGVGSDVSAAAALGDGSRVGSQEKAASSRRGHWWEWPEQAACPAGVDMHDDAFPAGESQLSSPVKSAARYLKCTQDSTGHVNHDPFLLFPCRV